MRALLLPLVLVACGPVVVDASAEAIESAERSTPGGAPCPSETEDARAARTAIARVRAMAGLSPLRCDAAASESARGHCGYVVANGVFTHVQSPSGKRFTGVTFGDRLRSASFTESPAGEVLANLRGDQAILGRDGFLNSVYHRALFLRTETTSFGYGGEGDCATIDFGRGPSDPGDRTVIWPPDGARNVPPEFWSSRELPNPLPGTTVVGAPITVTRASAFSQHSAALVGPNGQVDAAVLVASTDPNKLVRRGEVHVVPLAPLAPHTTYRATIALDGEEIATTFTTGAR